jgi:hypothetical protein
MLEMGVMKKHRRCQPRTLELLAAFGSLSFAEESPAEGVWRQTVGRGRRLIGQCVVARSR